MRISDWSSDVCSSDLEGVEKLGLDRRHHEVVEKNADRRFIIDDDVVDAYTAQGERRGVEAGDLGRREIGDEGGEIADIARRGLVDERRIEIGRASCRARVCQTV